MTSWIITVSCGNSILVSTFSFPVQCRNVRSPARCCHNLNTDHYLSVGHSKNPPPCSSHTCLVHFDLCALHTAVKATLPESKFHFLIFQLKVYEAFRRSPDSFPPPHLLRLTLELTAGATFPKMPI